MENILWISGRKSERERERLIRSKKDTFEDDERNIFNNIDFKMIEAKKRRRRIASLRSFFFSPVPRKFHPSIIQRRVFQKFEKRVE